MAGAWARLRRGMPAGCVLRDAEKTRLVYQTAGAAAEKSRGLYHGSYRDAEKSGWVYQPARIVAEKSRPLYRTRNTQPLWNRFHRSRQLGVRYTRRHFSAYGRPILYTWSVFSARGQSPWYTRRDSTAPVAASWYTRRDSTAPAPVSAVRPTKRLWHPFSFFES